MKVRIIFYACSASIALFFIGIIVMSVASLEDEKCILLKKVIALCDSDINNITLSFYSESMQKNDSVVIEELEDIEYFCAALKDADSTSFAKAKDIFRVRVNINYINGQSFIIVGRIRNKNNFFISEEGRNHISIRIEGLGGWLVRKIKIYKKAH